MDNYLFVHLSDIHFGQGKADGTVDWHYDVRDHVLEDCKVVAAKLNRPAYGVIVTGDIAYSAKSDEYRDANGFLEKLSAIVGCGSSEMYVVPGNHDVDRKVNVGVDDLVNQQLRLLDVQSIEARLQTYSQNAIESHPLYQKLGPYRDFAKTFECDFIESGKPFWSHDLNFEGVGALRMMGLCSVQVCDHLDNKGMMILGSKQYLLPVADGVEYVALMHHPLEWFKDRDEIEKKFNSRVRVLICGHEHRARIALTRFETDCEQIIVDSGALNPPANGSYSFTYNWLDFYVREDQGKQNICVRIYPRVWNASRDKFVADQNRMDLDADEGKEFIVCAPRLKLCVPSTAVPSVEANSSELSQETEATESSLENSSEKKTEDKKFKRLKYLFWQLPWQKRLRILVEKNMINGSVEKEMPHDLELWALNAAKENGQLSEIWNAIMANMPEDKREPNPFGDNREDPC